jgi:hypothetical protein
MSPRNPLRQWGRKLAAAWHNRSRNRILALYFDGYLQRRDRLQQAVHGQGNLQVAIYDLESSIIWPLVDMGYLKEGELKPTPQNADQVLVELDRLFRSLGFIKPQ